MTLRRQLLLVSLLLLSVPWAGCQFAKETELALRQAQLNALQANAVTIATAIDLADAQLPGHTTAESSTGPVLFAPAVAAAPIVDGYSDGWSSLPQHTVHADGSDQRLLYRARQHADALYLLLEYRRRADALPPPTAFSLADGRLWIYGSAGTPQFQLQASAPGAMSVYNINEPGKMRRDYRISAVWQQVDGGYNVELKVPLPAPGEPLGFVLHPGADRPTLGNLGPQQEIPRLIYPIGGLRSQLQSFTPPGWRSQVFSNSGWLLADSGTAASTASPVGQSTPWLLRAIYRRILEPLQNGGSRPDFGIVGRRLDAVTRRALSGEVASGRYRLPAADAVLQEAAVPLQDNGHIAGVLVLSQDAEQYLSLTDRAFARMMSVSVVVVLLALVGLLVFAGLLSFRIRRLGRAVDTALAEDGSLSSVFPASRSADEIGVLSRNYADLLNRLQAYHQHLRKLSQTLQHELKTPIAVIGGSLEQLEDASPDQQQLYLERARDGLGRLNRILSAMSEATALESAIADQDRQALDLVPLLQQLLSAYPLSYPRQSFVLQCDLAQAVAEANADLLVQLLDKLVDNAVSYAASSTPVTLLLQRKGSQLMLAVQNQGPPLPATAADLFQSLISLREGNHNRTHLGLGLYIARLIADFHDGQLTAENVPGGVRVTLGLPALS